MPDIIQLLPDAVANQIAAGEVVQRPASVVKELMENALDAGATEIKLIVKDSGKTLIQVMDNGCGMSETDARLSFERHATSKIRKAEDLYLIRTMGFRGEALPSVAAVAQVELKTKRIGDEVGVKIDIEGSEVKKQEACLCSEGTSIAVKNLFFNIPARRNFLKSDAVEVRHIIDEFQRVVIPNPEIAFSFHHNGAEIFHLERGNLKQRLMAVFGNSYNQRLLSVEENTDIAKIKGFVVKPEFAKKTRGEQFFFLNKRFIKNAYLHHAVQSAFQDLLPKENFASYFLMIDVDPKTIDINIHPTKTEVKFEDERAVYAYLKSTIKKTLGQNNITPSIDFDQEAYIFNIPAKPADGVIRQPQITIDPNYNPFTTSEGYQKPKPSEREISNRNNWERMYEVGKNIQSEQDNQHTEIENEVTQQTFGSNWDSEVQEANKKLAYQLHNKYIVSNVKSGLMLIDQHGAHERVLYERIIEKLDNQKSATQQEMFPKSLTLTTSDFSLIKELQPELESIGFDIQELGKNTVVVHGIPADMIDYDATEMLEGLLETFKQNFQELKLNKRENLARTMARNLSIKQGKKLTQEEMNHLTDELFACNQPNVSPAGNPTFIVLSMEELDERFNK